MQTCVDSHLSLLGLKVKDVVTQKEGVVTSVSFDLYGCIQAVVTDKDNDHQWRDVTRLEVTSDVPVMKLPDFAQGYVAEGRKGPADKPAIT